ncbi:hypothetical protein MBLNU13_g00427t2 [Cladosporium sp. NU13]
MCVQKAAWAASVCALYLRVQAGVSLSAMMSPTSLADGDAPSRSINTTFADGNHGFQAGTITGPVHTEFHQHAPEAPETPPNPASTILPFESDPDYVQRGSLLEQISVKLSRLAARVALVGLGGVGKTQLAIEYAHQLRLQSPRTWILWFYASNGPRFEQSVRGVLDQLRVRGRKDPKANVFQLLRDRLCDTSKGEWLVILDNADDARVLLGSPSTNTQANESGIDASRTEARLDYIPRCHHGRVLVTSRSKDTAQELVYQKDIIAVGPMEEQQALALLCKKLDTWYAEQDAPQLARALDYMPLALTQAAAYIYQNEGRCSIEQYLGKIQQCDISGSSVLDISARDLRRDREASNSIMLTWQISFNHIREVRPSASDLLSLMSFFDCQTILKALVQEKGNDYVEKDVDRGDKLNNMSRASDDEHHDENHKTTGARDLGKHDGNTSANTAETFEKDLIVLRNYHFVAPTADVAVLEMHRLVQLATKKWLRANGQLERWGSQFISNLYKAFPPASMKNWKRMQERSLEGRKSVLGEGHPFTLMSMNNLATTYSRQGRWERAEKLQLQVMNGSKAVLGAGHPFTLTTMNNLAMTYLNQERLDEAEKVQVEVLEKNQEVLGAGHPFTLTGIGNLALTYSRKGQWEKSEELQVEVMEKRKKVLRAGHPDTLTSMSNLATTYLQQGQWKKSEDLQVEVMQKRKELLGAGHPDMLKIMGNLALTYLRQERWEEAEKLQEEVTEKREEVLGTRHPDTLTSMSNLAVTYSRQGRWEQAEKLQLQVMEGSKEVLGEGHPSTLTSMSNLAMTYLDQGRLDEAEKMQAEATKKSKEVLGAGNSFTLTIMGNLALTYLRQKRREEAEKLQEEVTEKRKEVLGTRHPDTLTSMSDLAVTYSRQGRWEEAEKLQEEVLEKRKEAHGERHPSTLTSISSLTLTYTHRGRWNKAEKLQVEVMEKSKEMLGAGHPDTLTSMNNLAHTYSQQGRWEEAEKVQVEAMEKSKESLGERHPDTLTRMRILACTKRALGRSKSALDLIDLCADMSQAILGMSHPDTVVALHARTKWKAEEMLDSSAEGGSEGQRGKTAHVVHGPSGTRWDTVEDGILWYQPQFLWLL